ncbi:MAG: hypothetical protein GEU78_10310 [Actinobacteria bacterium]|nr:hypothetical protein [Actinomycetota bacterium]
MADENVVVEGKDEAVILPSATPNAPEGMPEGGTEKFWSADKKEYNWQAHARDAEYRFAQSKKDRDAADALTNKPDADPTKPDAGGEGGTPSGTGLDLSVYTSEYQETGALSEESFSSLEKQGISREVAEQYIAGAEAIAEKRQNEIYVVSGGEENYKAMINWAAEGLSKEEIVAFNKLAENNDPSQFKLAVEALYGRYADANGVRAQRRVVGGGSGSGAAGGDAYESWAEVTKDMRDPRYKNDPAYQKAVTAKLDRSPLDGVRVVNSDVRRG